MTTVTGLTIGGGFGTTFKQATRQYYNRHNLNIADKRRIFSRTQKAQIASQSVMAEVNLAWDDLTTEEQEAWRLAGEATGMNGFNLYTQDKIYRIQHNLTGNATPSLYHFYKYGKITAPEGGGTIIYRQSSGYSPTGTVTMEINHKSVLTADGASPNTLKMIYRYWYGDSESPTEVEEVMNLPIDTDWRTETHTFTCTGTPINGFELDFELIGVKGYFYFDNVQAYDLEDSYTDDLHCNNVTKYWRGIIVPEGANIETIYTDA